MRADAVTPPVMAPDGDVCIVGAGPVGLLLAHFLGVRGRRVLVVERREGPPSQSMAIGITPPSLAILGRVDLAQPILDAAVRVRRATVHADGRTLGAVDFSSLRDPHPFILTLPQARTVGLLEQALALRSGVRLLRGVELLDMREGADHVELRLRDVRDGVETRVRTAYAAGCDGARSRVRDAAGLRVRTRAYGVRFAMADFVDTFAPDAGAHVYFTARGSVEAFPLPGGRRRWVVQDRDGAAALDEANLRARVRERTGQELPPALAGTLTAFRPQRLQARTFARGRIVLCGDAAHTMSPIGGQGMNTGFADAELLGEVLDRALSQPAHAQRCLGLYNRARRRAFRVAAARAARGMWLGTRTGVAASRLRGWFIREVLLRRPLCSHLAPYFAMLTIPFRSAAQVRLPDAAPKGTL